jgi:hypothetical protein
MSAARSPLTRPSLRSGLPLPAVRGEGRGEGRARQRWNGRYTSAASEM